ncbi:MAG: Mur ligase domain-containing protein, partial [Candidatus Latescibacterota bacterium]|nr:Mur ligase domain-containing protein [Candidatus Latescibacterota bacterium]
MAISNRYKWAHMVGIGGAGMASLARLLKAQGMYVTGSDMASSSTVSGLAREGFSIGKGHCAAQVGDADLLIYSAAIPDSNVERLEAEGRGIRCASRAEVLGELSRARRTIAIAGTHGKTTTASLMTEILYCAG